MSKLPLLIILFILNILCSTTSVAQSINWQIAVDGGIVGMRNFDRKMADKGYNFQGAEGSVSWRLKNRPDYLVRAGIIASGDFQSNGLLGWEAGLTIKHSGFRVTTDLLEASGSYEDLFIVPPQFDQTESFRYWAVQLPLSITYTPFETVGFLLGADLSYQFTSDLTHAEYMEVSRLERHIGRYATYEHPFTLGGHLGVFLPIGEQFRIDAQLFSDIIPRLKLSQNQGATEFDDEKYREMGVSLGIRYNLNW